jgi:hypothetical protein
MATATKTRPAPRLAPTLVISGPGPDGWVTLLIAHGTRYATLSGPGPAVRIDGRRYPELFALAVGCCEMAAPHPLLDWLLESPPSDAALWFAEAGMRLLADPDHDVGQGEHRIR